jgi:hypothetical protein
LTRDRFFAYHSQRLTRTTDDAIIQRSRATDGVTSRILLRELVMQILQWIMANPAAFSAILLLVIGLLPAGSPLRLLLEKLKLLVPAEDKIVAKLARNDEMPDKSISRLLIRAHDLWNAGDEAGAKLMLDAAKALADEK